MVVKGSAPVKVNAPVVVSKVPEPGPLVVNAPDIKVTVKSCDPIINVCPIAPKLPGTVPEAAPVLSVVPIIIDGDVQSIVTGVPVA